MTDMEMNESTITAARAMTVLLGRLDTDSHEGAGESISTDKECHNALLTLSDAMVDRDASNDGSGNQHDLITFMDRIVRCKANVVSAIVRRLVLKRHSVCEFNFEFPRLVFVGGRPDHLAADNFLGSRKKYQIQFRVGLA